MYTKTPNLSESRGHDENVQSELNRIRDDAKWTLLNSGIGNSALISPFIFANLGILPGLIFLVLISFLMRSSWHVLVNALQKFETKGSTALYRKDGRVTLMEAFLDSKEGGGVTLQSRICAGFNFFYLLFSSTTYFMIIRSYMKGEYASMKASGPEGDINFHMILVTFLFPIFIEKIRHRTISLNRKFYMIGIIFVIILYIVTTLFSVQYILERGVNFTMTIGPNFQSFSAMQVVSCFGAFIFCFDINGTITVVRKEFLIRYDRLIDRLNDPNEIEKEGHGKFKEILDFYLKFTVISIALVGVISVLAFGSNNTESLIFTLEKAGFQQFYSNMCRTMLILGLFTNIIQYTIPLMNTLRESSELFMRDSIEENVPSTISFKETVIGLVYYFVISTSLVFFLGFMKPLNVLGGLSSIFLGFVFPYLIVEKEDVSCQNYLVLLFGLLGGCIALSTGFS